jgi:hypothetical protein
MLENSKINLIPLKDGQKKARGEEEKMRTYEV